MGVRWSQQLGNTERFAIELRFEDDPDDGAHCTPDEASSWGAFRIWVRGKNVCAHLEEDEMVNAIHWYLIGLLEWFSDHWEPLLHEEKLPLKNSADDAWGALEKNAFPPIHLEESLQRNWENEWAAWRSRHALQTAREGGLFPDVVFRRWRDSIEISWGDSPPAGAPAHYRFLADRGMERVRPKELAEPLHGVLTSAAEFLLSENPASARVRALAKKLQNIRSVSLEERLVWLVGLGRTTTEMSRNWNQLKSELDSMPKGRDALWPAMLPGMLAVEGTCQAALMFGSASPTLKRSDVLHLAELAVHAYQPTRSAESKRLRDLVRDEPPTSAHEEDYEYGYKLAEEVLESLEALAHNIDFVDMEKVLRQLKIRTVELDLTDVAIRAVSIASPTHRPTIAINPRHRFNFHASGRRFTLAHELCHILFDRSAGRQLALISGPWAPVALERRANAFAAMLLMPTEIVRRILGTLTAREDSAEGIREIASAFSASPSAALEHIANLQRWDASTRDRVRNELVEVPMEDATDKAKRGRP